MLKTKEISFLRYQASANASKELPQREAYLNVSRNQAEMLAGELGAKFVSRDNLSGLADWQDKIGGHDACRPPLVVFFDDDWKSADPASWQKTHLLVEHPPRYGGPPLVIEAYPDEDAFKSQCPSPHHVNWISKINNNKNSGGVVLCWN